MLIVHYAVKTDPSAEAATSVRLERKILDPVEPIPPAAIWIDMVEPTVDEDRKVERYLGAKVPSRSDPDFAQPSESYYAENGVRYLHACVVSEAENTPDVAEVTFILGPKALVTVRYDPGEAFELFGQRLGKIPAQVLHPDAVAVGLINAIVDRSARALNKVGVELDSDREPGISGQGRPKRAQQDLFRDPRRARPRGREDLKSARKPGGARAARAVPDV